MKPVQPIIYRVVGAECSSAVIIYTPRCASVGFRLAAAAFMALFARLLTEILLDDTPQAFPGVDETVQRVLRNVVPLCEQTAVGLGYGCGVVETTRRNECNCGIRHVVFSPSASIFNIRIRLSLL